MANIQAFMEQSEHPMLLIYADPGTLILPHMLPWYQARIQKLTIAYVGQGTHFIQEDQPDLIGQAIANWLEPIA
jgi:haloalkane dehalogenase